MESFELIILIIIIIVTTTVVCSIIAVTDYNEDNDEYVYLLSNVTDKYTESTTTYSVVSTGKASYTVPITTTHYYIKTKYGEVLVSSDYNIIQKGDTVVLENNLNKSCFNYVCKITEV